MAMIKTLFGKTYDNESVIKRMVAEQENALLLRLIFSLICRHNKNIGSQSGHILTRFDCVTDKNTPPAMQGEGRSLDKRTRIIHSSINI